MNSLSVKKGDNVVVLTGKDKGKTGNVLVVSSKTNRVIVQNVNIVKKHKKARSAQEKSEIITKEAPIDASNVMVICSSCNKATRIGNKEVGGKIVRVCKKCGAGLDNESKKEVKKVAKTTKTVKEEKTEEKPKTKRSSAKKGE